MNRRAPSVPDLVDYERLADIAELGFDPTGFHGRRRGRPSLSQSGTSPRIATRVPAAVHARAQARAASEGRTISEVLRSMVEAYAKGAESDRVRSRTGPAIGGRRRTRS